MTIIQFLVEVLDVKAHSNQGAVENFLSGQLHDAHRVKFAKEIRGMCLIFFLGGGI